MVCAILIEAHGPDMWVRSNTAEVWTLRHHFTAKGSEGLHLMNWVGHSRTKYSKIIYNNPPITETSIEIGNTTYNFL